MSILIPIRDLEIGDRFIWCQMNGTPLYPTPYSPRGVYSENYISQVYFKNGVDILHKKTQRDVYIPLHLGVRSFVGLLGLYRGGFK